jgi:hypothetical protein
MSDRLSRDPRAVIERLLPEAFEGSRRSPVMSTFLRGVTTGALVGAAIAGSALWSRYRRTRDHREAVEPAGEAPATTPAQTDPSEPNQRGRPVRVRPL